MGRVPDAQGVSGEDGARGRVEDLDADLKCHQVLLLGGAGGRNEAEPVTGGGVGGVKADRRPVLQKHLATGARTATVIQAAESVGSRPRDDPSLD